MMQSSRILSLTWFLLLSLVISACNLANPPITPTPIDEEEVLISETPTSTPLPPTNTPTQTLTPTVEVEDVPVIIATQAPQVAENRPTIAPIEPSPTPGPWTYTVREGETLGFILQLQPWGYPPFDAGITNAVVRLNGLSGPTDLRSGQELLIPRRTATPIPDGIELTQQAAQTRGQSVIGGQAFALNQEFGCHTVQENDTILGIMEIYSTTLEVLAQQNDNLNWTGCAFNNPSGGPNCNPSIGLGQCINVPLPTRTPVPSATPSGNETATPTPTYPPAPLILPVPGSIASGRVELQWVSVGNLKPTEAYLIEITDPMTGEIMRYATRNTIYRLPASLIPSDGQQHTVEWRVSVAERNPDGTVTPIGGAGPWRSFQWR